MPFLRYNDDMAIWFTSDTHYGHESIIRHCDRPYKSVGEMNYDMARRWNELVSEDDIVYHLGDFAMGDPLRYPTFRDSLKGQIVLVRGNHDDEKIESVIGQMRFADVVENVIVEIEGLRVWLNHYPLSIPDHRGRPFERPQPPGRYDVILCGHVHQQFKVRNGNVNVGVDVWKFRPISIADIKAALDSADISD